MTPSELAEIRKRQRERQASYDYAKESSGEPLSACGPQYHQDISKLLAHVETVEARLSAFFKHCEVVYVDMTTDPQQSFHYCAICGRHSDDVPLSVELEHAEDCPMRGIALKGQTPSEGEKP